MMKRIIVALVLLCPCLLWAQVEKVEYFFDTDPGYGNGTDAGTGTIETSGSGKDWMSFSPKASLEGLDDGIHTFYVRAKNKQGWSQVQSRTFMKTTLPGETSAEVKHIEYFFDTDPGYGAGNALDATSDNDQYIFDIGLDGLSDGIHTFYLRAKNQQGWSQVVSRTFMKTTLPGETSAEVKRIEYFFDTDPGYGAGNALDATSNNDQYVFDIDLNGLSDGFHSFYIRAQDNYGRWSHVVSRSFYKTIFPEKLSPDIVYAEYYFDTDPGKEKGIEFPYVLADESIHFIANLNGLGTGEHKIYLRGKFRSGSWEIIGQHTFTLIDGDFIGTIDNNGIKVYPNPVVNELFIKNNNRDIEQVDVISINGQVLYQHNTEAQLIHIPFNSYPAGAYLIRIITKEETKTMKVVKQ